MIKKILLAVIVYITIQIFSSCEKELPNSTEIKTISFPQETYYLKVGERKLINVNVYPKVDAPNFQYEHNNRCIVVQPIGGRSKVYIVGIEIGSTELNIVTSKKDYPLLERNQGTRVVVTN